MLVAHALTKLDRLSPEEQVNYLKKGTALPVHKKYRGKISALTRGGHLPSDEHLLMPTKNPGQPKLIQEIVGIYLNQENEKQAKELRTLCADMTGVTLPMYAYDIDNACMNRLPQEAGNQLKSRHHE